VLSKSEMKGTVCDVCKKSQSECELKIEVQVDEHRAHNEMHYVHENCLETFTLRV
jgi:hypothetical protein